MPSLSNPQPEKTDSESFAINEVALGFVRATEQGAIAAASWRGKGAERAADMAAMDALHHSLNNIGVNATIVIGEEGEKLYVGEAVGAGNGPRLDIAVDPLEGTTLCAKNLNDALVALAVAEPGNLLHVPNIYMHKIAIGPGYPDGLVDLDASPSDNVAALAQAKKVPVSEISVCVLDRPRHGALIEQLRSIGASVRLIGDGDIAGVIHAANVFESGIDIYLGSGGAPEGVLAAAAIRCLGGFMQARLILDRPDQVQLALKAGITEHDKKYQVDDLAAGNVLFAATGVTSGALVDGVRIGKHHVHTASIVMNSLYSNVRWISTRHSRQSLVFVPGGSQEAR
ncbi:Fructose-1,6-bisphosphatase, GlpX type [hydrothermal vent metagenome]|uniref:Fructose-1,6-bisphosphatase, GlpX type n=1 Tax=hydrothermal vent metagenome TaxID=652676 RepID=A0A3B0TTF4_9ZZZZ